METFKVNDIVVLRDEYKEISRSYKNIVGKKLTVKECKEVNLVDMITMTVRFDTSTPGVQNPYLASHFKLFEDEKSNQ